MREFHLSNQLSNNHSLAIFSGVKKYRHFPDCEFATFGLDEMKHSLLRLGSDVVTLTDGNVSRPSFVKDCLSSLNGRDYSQIFIYFSSWVAHTRQRQIALLFNTNSVPWKAKTFLTLQDLLSQIPTNIPTFLVLDLYGFPNETVDKFDLENIKTPDNLGVIMNKNIEEYGTERANSWIVNRLLEVFDYGPKTINNYTAKKLVASLQALAKLRLKKSQLEIANSVGIDKFEFWNTEVQNRNSLLFYTGDDINSEILGEREDSIQELRHFLTNTNNKEVAFLAQEHLLQRLNFEENQRVVNLIRDVLLGQKHKSIYQNLLHNMQIKFEAVNVPNIPFVTIPEGKFIMGTNDPSFPPENPAHEVFLPSYRISKYPITWQDYLCFLRDTDYPFTHENYTGNDHLEHPVNYVSWYDSMAFCDWLTKVFLKNGIIQINEQILLPTESEWEKAARGTDGGMYPWGDYYELNLCNDVNSKAGFTTKVGSYSPRGDSVYGCADIVGNVHEWTLSLWGKGYRSPRYKYPYDSSDGREDWDASSSIRRVVRGGAFYYDPSCVRCSTRNYKYPALRQVGSGFRVVCKPISSVRSRT